MKFQQELLALFLQQHHAVFQQENMQGLHPLTVAQLHHQGTLEDEAVPGELQVLVLHVDGVVPAHLVQAGGVQIGLDLDQLLVVQLAGNLGKRKLISSDFVFFLEMPLCVYSRFI